MTDHLQCRVRRSYGQRKARITGAADWVTLLGPVEVKMRTGSVVLAVWLLIGLVAAVQRGYFGTADTTCAGVGTVLVTMVAGPLNYLGVNPKVQCQTPRPAR
jgi:hypothetical protein